MKQSLILFSLFIGAATIFSGEKENNKNNTKSYSNQLSNNNNRSVLPSSGTRSKEKEELSKIKYDFKKRFNSNDRVLREHFTHHQLKKAFKKRNNYKQKKK